MTSLERDQAYLDLLLNSIRVCRHYKPKMGKGTKAGLSLKDFQMLYRADPFYSWFGLDNALMYAAHKAAGGMTSVYRQIGIGCERLFNQILQDNLQLSPKQASWSYILEVDGGRKRRLSLDGRIHLKDISEERLRQRVTEWLAATARQLDVDDRVAASLQGVVFEVRQGYKSKDSKRQNADLANAATAYTQAYLPCLAVMSAQIDEDIATRYRASRWALLTGSPLDQSILNSTYVFAKDVLGFDLARFFERSAPILRREIANTLQQLLSTENNDA